MSDFFQFLSVYDDAQVADILSEESADVAVAALGSLPPDRAAAILRRLPKKDSAEVSLKLARAESVDQSVMAAMERALRKKFFSVISGAPKAVE